jgi:hypothetical protein
LRGVIVSELIREREAKFSKHPIRTFVRNWPETLSDHPTLSNISATTKAETVFNSGVECFMFVKLACGADTKQSFVVATHSNQFRIPPRRDPEILQNQIKTASSNQFHPHRARGNSTVKLAQDVPPRRCDGDIQNTGFFLQFIWDSTVKPRSAQVLHPLQIPTSVATKTEVSQFPPDFSCAVLQNFAAAKDGWLTYCFGAM